MQSKGDRSIWLAVVAVGLAVAIYSKLSGIPAAVAQDPNAGSIRPVPVAGQKVSPLIFPEQDIPLKFSHILHLEKVKSTCVDCHQNVRSSESSLDNNMPGEVACRACHTIDRSEFQPETSTGKGSGRCIDCHEGFDAKAGSPSIRHSVMPIARLKFSHKSHLNRGTSCERCHGDFVSERVVKATREKLPEMAVCLDCHDGKKAPNRCTTCHLSASGGVVKTDFAESGQLRPTSELSGAAHTMNFRTSHKVAAEGQGALCASCHKKNYCVDCHNGVTKPMDFHVGDYIATHSIDARRNSTDCSSCHRLQTFCQGCHSRLGVAGDGKSPNLLDGIRFHPAGWSGVGGRGPNHHSFRAQRNIKECASCHRESFCTKCHSNQMGSPQINPHPRNWRGSQRCESLLKRNKRMCLRCHTESAQLRCL